MSSSTVAIFSTHEGAEGAITDLQRSGYDMKRLSIVGRDYTTDEHVVGYYTTGDRMKTWGRNGAFWGGIWGLLFGSAFFFVPGVGPLLVAGPMVAWIVSGLEGALVVGGLSALGAGLVSLGIPKDSVLRYETAIKNDKFLVVADGTAVDVARAKEILSHFHPDSVDLHP